MSIYLWPKLEAHRSQAWQEDLASMAKKADRLATKVTVYAGGGSPAHELREAAKLIDSARARIKELES